MPHAVDFPPRAFLAQSLVAGALVAGSLLAGGALAQGNNPDFRVNNRSGSEINELYVSSSRQSGWGRDLLGNNTLAQGQSFNVVLPAGQCVNDIRVVYASGAAQEQRGVNTCGITDYTINR